MWELTRQVGMIRNFHYKVGGAPRISLRFSSYKDDTFKIKILSHHSPDIFIEETITVPSGDLEDVQKEAVKEFNEFAKKENKFLAAFNKSKSKYEKYFKEYKKEK